MRSYTAPVRDSLFVLREVLDIAGSQELAGESELDSELLEALVGEAGRFCDEVIAPLNTASDDEGCTRHPDGLVTTPSGFPAAYRQYVEAGWGTLALPAGHGGQGLPHVVASVVEEYLNSACQAFTMYPGLAHGAVAMVASVGDDSLKDAYLADLVSGEVLGTMALTEPHCGTDLGLIRTRAEPADGAFTLTGEKIFCSGGEQDLTDNIVHLVLARIAGAAPGSRGLSLFLVPKILPDGTRNAVSCGAIEHKMGLSGNATCAMQFEGAKGWLLGEENGGLTAMFIMMNAARLSCGNQGLAQAERAYQNACAYALDRRQGRAAGRPDTTDDPADPIILHPDIRRLLMDARAFTEGFRALVAWTAWQIDLSQHAVDSDVCRHSDALVGLLTPVLKAFGSDRGFETAVAMQQVFGGHGYIKEWGMEQYVRDARAAMIYEGANGVQALDLVGRKLVRDEGRAAGSFFGLIESDCAHFDQSLAEGILAALADARASADWLRDHSGSQPGAMGASAYAFMQILGTLALGWMWGRIDRVALEALEAGSGESQFYRWKRLTARHHIERSLPETALLRRKVELGSQNLMALPPEAFGA